MSSFRNGHEAPTSDEEYARRLQMEEQQQSSRNLNTGTQRYKQQELDDLALARQYSKMYLEDARGTTTPNQRTGQQQYTHRHHSHQEQLRSPQQTQNSYSNHRASARRSQSGIINATSLGVHSYSDMDGHGNNSRSQSFRDPFDYGGAYKSPTSRKDVTTRAAYEDEDFKSPSARREVAAYEENYFKSPPSQHNGIVGTVYENDYMKSPSARNESISLRKHQESECHPSYNSTFDNTMKNNVLSTSLATLEDHDLELARRMQDLEDRGLGQQNSDRMIVSMKDDDDLDYNELKKASPPSGEKNNNDSDNFHSIAKLLSDSGEDMNALPDDILYELLGSKNNHSYNGFTGSQPTLTGATAATFLSPNKESHDSHVDSSSSTINNNTNRPSISPKTGKSPRAPTGTAVMLKDFDHSHLNDAMLPTDNASKHNSSKVKRRGLFGFALADKNKFNLDQITMDAPTTTLLPASSPLSPTPPTTEPTIERKLKSPPLAAGVTTNGGGGIPPAIPPAPTDHIPGQRLTRSVSPTPRTSDSFNAPRNNSSMQLRNPTIVPTSAGPIVIPPSIPSGIPSAIPPKPAGMMTINQSFSGLYRGTNICAACGLSHGTFLKVLDRKYHPDCLRCTSCQGRIDPHDQFKYTTDDKGRVQPYHRECFLSFGVQCCVCQEKVPVTPDGRVPYIKHPFFTSELMCVRHANEDIRRCCGCQRLEPYNMPYIDLMDEDRCVCPSCCESVVVDSSEATPIWMSVLKHLEEKFQLPIWESLREIPILMVGVESLKEQMLAQGSMFSLNSQNILAAGLCLTEQSQNRSYGSSYAASTPPSDQVVAILCPTGLPRALVASILAHESIQAWIQLHPNYRSGRPLSLQVLKGLSQLVAFLFLSDGVIPNSDQSNSAMAINGSSEKKLRQYYKFCIERDQSDVYGNGYRRAAVAYREIGMEGLLSHVLEYRDFPPTTDDIHDGMSQS